VGTGTGRLLLLGCKSSDDSISGTGDRVAGQFGTILASTSVGDGSAVTHIAVTGAPDAATAFPTREPLVRELSDDGGESDEGELLLMRRSVNLLASCGGVVTAWHL
jgi:hypothetical protein